MFRKNDNRYKKVDNHATNSQSFCTFANNMETTIIEDDIFEIGTFEEDGSVLLAAEASWRGMADELQELHYLKGAQFINQLKLIIYYRAWLSRLYTAKSEKLQDCRFHF